MGSVVTGYKYFFGIHMGVSRGPIDELCQIKVGDRTAWAGSVKSNEVVSINQPELFGGEDSEGGIVGNLEVMFGEPTQTASTGMKAMLGNTLPGFRRMFTAFYDGLVATNNPYPKAWKFRVRRALKGWDGEVFLPEYAVIKILAEEVPSDMQPEVNTTTTGTYTAPPSGWLRIVEDGTGSGGEGGVGADGSDGPGANGDGSGSGGDGGSE